MGVAVPCKNLADSWRKPLKTMESSSALSRCIRRRFLALSSSVAWEDEGVATAAVDAEAWDQAEFVASWLVQIRLHLL